MSHRVLVVDDEESIRALLTTHLEDLGYQVVTAADGASGITTFDARRPHAVIVDFLLPRGNGFAVAEAIRSREAGATVPILMMSGVFKNPKTAVEAREKYQVLDFLSKPLDLALITDHIRGALRGVPVDEDPAPEPLAFVEESEPSPPPRGLSYFAPAERPANGAVRPPPVPLTRSAPELVREGVFVGRPFPVVPTEGELVELPVALLLSSLRFDEVTGMLDMTDRGTHRRIYIVSGNPTFMQSNAEGENVGALLLQRGRITEPDFDRCLRYMKNERRTLQRALLDLKLVSEQDLATAYKLLAGQLLPVALGMGAGSFSWRETDAFVGRVPEGRFEPVSVLFDGIKRHVHPPQILRFFRGCEDVPLLRTLQFDGLMSYFSRTFSKSNVSGEIDGSETYRSLTHKHPERVAEFAPQLFALVTSGMAILPEQDADQQMAAAVHRATADVEFSAEYGSDDFVEIDVDDDGHASSEDLQARGVIERFHHEIMSQDFFQIFSATPDSEPDAVKAKYFELAARWHDEAFAERNLGAAKQKLDEIFGRMTEAYETISDKSKRQDYLVYLDRRARGLPTDPAELRRAEQLFDQAAAMIEREDWQQASPVLEEASRRNPDPLYIATLGWVTFNLAPYIQENVTEAVNLLKKAVQTQENLPAAYQYLGQIAFQRGQTSEAQRWWTRCLEWEPNNAEAVRGIRMIEDRSDTATGSRRASEPLRDKE